MYCANLAKSPSSVRITEFELTEVAQTRKSALAPWTPERWHVLANSAARS